MTDFLAFSQTPLFVICIFFFFFFTLLAEFFLISSYFSYLALNYFVSLIIFHLNYHISSFFNHISLGGLENKFKANYGELGVTASLPIETKKVTETETDISEIDRRILALQDYLENARYEN